MHHAVIVLVRNICWIPSAAYCFLRPQGEPAVTNQRNNQSEKKKKNDRQQTAATIQLESKGRDISSLLITMIQIVSPVRFLSDATDVRISLKKKERERIREEKEAAVAAGTLTAGPFVLDGDGPLQGTAHGPHLTGAAVAVAVGAAHRVGRLRTRLGALAHRLAVLHHAHSAVLAHLVQARAGLAEV